MKKEQGQLPKGVKREIFATQPGLNLANEAPIEIMFYAGGLINIFNGIADWGHCLQDIANQCLIH